MAHCGYLTNKGWSHSGHIALVGSSFFLKETSCFSLLVPVSQDYKITWPWDPSDYVLTRPQLRAKDKLRTPSFRAQFSTNRVYEQLAVKGEHWFLSKASHFFSSCNKSFSARLPSSLFFSHARLTMSCDPYKVIVIKHIRISRVGVLLGSAPKGYLAFY